MRPTTGGAMRDFRCITSASISARFSRRSSRAGSRKARGSKRSCVIGVSTPPRLGIGASPRRRWVWRSGLRTISRVGATWARASGVRRTRATRRRRRVYAALVVFVLAVAGVLWSAYHGLLTASAIAAGVGYLLLLVTLGFFIWLFRAGTWSAAERKQLIAITVLFMAATACWSLFEQAGSTLNLFAQRSTRNEIAGLAFPASWWQSLNSLYIILLAPLMAWLWVRLGPSDPSSPTKFTLGLFFAAAGFGVLAVAADLAADGVRVSPMWLALVYLLHTVGELCLSPIGLSAMTRLAPARIAGLVMGEWFLATSVGNYLGGQMASRYESFALPTLFTTITVVALIATLLMTAAVRPLARMISHKSN